MTVDASNAKDLPYTPGGHELDGDGNGLCGDDAEYEFEVLDCNSPGDCIGGPNFPECQGDPDCICVERWDGAALCVDGGLGCGDLESCDDMTGICPPNEICVVNTCCGFGRCVPPSGFCGATLAGDRELLPPGTLTIGGVIGEEED